MPVDKKESEQNLAMMEYQIRKHKAASLYEHGNVGFEMLDMSDQGDNAAGVRIFKIAGDEDDRTIYAPVFYNNNNIQGTELAFMKESDMVVPFTDKYVDAILSHVPNSLGDPAEMQDPATKPQHQFADSGTGKGDVRSLKSASTERAEAREWLSSMKEETEKVANALLEGGPSSIQLSAPLEDLAQEKSASVKSAFITAINGSNKFAEHIYNEHSEVLSSLAEPVDQPKLNLDKDASAEKELEFIDTPAEAATEKEAQLILEEGCAVRDNREYISKMYKEASLACESLNDRSGFVDVVTGEGADLMFNVPEENATKTVGRLLSWDNKQPIEYNGEEPFILTERRNKKKQWKNKFEELSDEPITPGTYDDYLFMGPDMNQAAIVSIGKVEDVVGDGRYELVSRPFKKQIRIGPAKRVMDREEEILIPKDWKGVEITGGFKTRTFPALEEILEMSATRVDIDKSSSSYIISTEDSTSSEPSYKDAMYNLVVEKRLPADDARSLLKEAEQDRQTHAFIKEAQPPGMPMAQPVGGPPPPAPAGPSMAGGQAGPAMAGGMMGGSPPPQGGAAQALIDKITQAVDQGQSKVIDVSSMGAIVDASNEEHVISKYLGDVITGMDRLGRILMTLYAHYDKFSDKWGEVDTETLVDKLSDNFKSLGDTILTLKEKTNNTQELQL